MGETGEIMLFGVRFVVDSMRKCVSLNNLSQYEHAGDSPKEDSAAVAGAGYVSADEALAHPASGSRGDRKRGVAWTEEEHKLFLLGLKRVGKGDWRGISRNYVKTRTPTQVASHAQKYFLRHTNVNRRRRRSSLFDITTDSVSAIPMEEEQNHEQDMNNTGSQLHLFPSAPPETSNGSAFSTLSAINRASSPVLPVSVEKLGNMRPEKVNEVTDLSTSFNRPVAILPAASRDTPFLDLNLDLDLTPPPAPCDTPVLDLNLDLNLIPTVEPAPVSLNLLLSSDRSSTSRHSAFQLVQGYNNLDNFIGVA